MLNTFQEELYTYKYILNSWIGAYSLLTNDFGPLAMTKMRLDQRLC